jgi:hypothetical protein
VIPAGIIDPVKEGGMALQNVTSMAFLTLTTEIGMKEKPLRIKKGC